jgi:hypothetical protein
MLVVHEVRSWDLSFRSAASRPSRRCISSPPGPRTEERTLPPWQKAVGKSVRELEYDWLGSLAQIHPRDAQAIHD